MTIQKILKPTIPPVVSFGPEAGPSAPRVPGPSSLPHLIATYPVPEPSPFDAVGPHIRNVAPRPANYQDTVQQRRPYSEIKYGPPDLAQ